MNFLGAAASRIGGSGWRTCPKRQKLDFYIKLVNATARPYTTSSTPFRRKRADAFNGLIQREIRGHQDGCAFESSQIIRPYSSSRIITQFDQLPQNYKDEQGLPFRAKPLSKDEARAVFGRGMDITMANRVLRILHGRRVAGTLADPSLRFPVSSHDDRIKKVALSWLRKIVPVDEEDAAGRRAELELQAMEAEEILARSESMGLYKTTPGESIPKPQGNQSVYGDSALDAIREARRKYYTEKEREEGLARTRKDEEARQKSGTLATQGTSSVELKQEREQHPWLKHYLERAKVLPDEPPEMSFWQRVLPTGLVTLAVLVGSVVFTQVYIPPENAARLWPDTPPAAATVTALIAMNTIVYIMWHSPPFFRFLNKYFISIPGYPRALSVIGTVFSHQTISHIGANMFVLWFMGTRLHDEIGRGNFLAIYLGSGVFSSFASMSIFAYRKNFKTSSLGASGAIAGVVGAYMWLHFTDQFKFFGLPPDPYPGFPGWLLLVPIILPDILSIRKMGKTGNKMDHYAHLGGFLGGFVGAQAVKKSWQERQAMLEKRRSRIMVLSPKQQ